MEAFLTQFYDDKDPPRLILLSHPVDNPDLVTEALAIRAGRKVELAVPQRGEKAELVENAPATPAKASPAGWPSPPRRTSSSGLAEAFDLDAPPQRIEVYDNSHIQGTNAVGGMIVAGPEGFLKSQYRKFNIKSEAGANSDDFGMMKEVLTRRFERLLKEDPERKTDMWPDLLLIDGGAGQVSAVAEIMSELGVEDIPWSASPRASTATPGKRNSTAPANAPSPCKGTTPSSTSSSASGMRPTAGPSAPTAPSGRRRSA
jgi:excinuclease ABC subunit C